MPHRIALGLILVGGCRFSADYPSGSVTCREGPCPEGLACVDTVCVVPTDAGPDGMDAIDAPPPALTCADPGTLAIGDTVMDSTVNRMNLITATCGGFVNNGRDAVYRIDVPMGTQLTVSITEGTRKAYVLSACTQAPQTPACLGNVRATMGNPIAVTTIGQPSFVVVDDQNSADAGDTYTLHVQ